MIENIGTFVRQNKLASFLGLAGAIGCFLLARWFVSKTPPNEVTTKKSDAVGQEGIKKSDPTNPQASSQSNLSSKPKTQNLQLSKDRILTLKANNTVFEVKQEFLDQFDLLSNDPQPDLSEYVDSNEHPGRNRYPNVLPFKNNIFQFENLSRYFNASRVLQERAISCQGPLKNEHEHFWRMVWESNTTAIIMLTDLVEYGHEKCSWYLPLDKEQALVFNDIFFQEGAIVVAQVDGPLKPVDNLSTGSTELVKRRLTLKYHGEQRTLTHYHLRGWGDFKAVPEMTLAELVLTVLEKHFSQGEHIISHCSAGIGRSGTFLATLGALSQLNHEPVNNNLVMDTVRQLRSPDDGRAGMVQTKEQYGLIFKTLAVLDPQCQQEFCT